MKITLSHLSWITGNFRFYDKYLYLCDGLSLIYKLRARELACTEVIKDDKVVQVSKLTTACMCIRNVYYIRKCIFMRVAHWKK